MRDDPFIFLKLWAAVCFMVACGFVIAANYDRVVVFLMRRFDMPLYPTAIGIAMLIIEHPEQWSCDRFEMRHPDIGAIWTANEAYALRIETAFGTWKPNKIERRIIRDAVDWRLHQYVRSRIALAVQKNALR